MEMQHKDQDDHYRESIPSQLVECHTSYLSSSSSLTEINISFNKTMSDFVRSLSRLLPIGGFAHSLKRHLHAGHTYAKLEFV